MGDECAARMVDPRVAEADSVLDALCDNLRAMEDLPDVHAAADLFRVN
ncbi:hypothetical protein [Streptomyces sp. NPDC056948]